MSLWYQPPGGPAVQVNLSDILIVDQGGVTRSVTLDVLFSALIGIQGVSSDDEQAQAFARGVTGIIRLDELAVSTPAPTTPQPTSSSTSSTSTSTTSTTTGAPGTPPSSTIVFSNFTDDVVAVAPSSTITFSNFS